MIAKFLERKLTAAGRTAAAVAVVSLSALAGTGFLTAAGWASLADLYGPESASAIVGGILLTPLMVVGLVRAIRRAGNPPTHDTPITVTLAQVVLAFTLAAKIGEGLGVLRNK